MRFLTEEEVIAINMLVIERYSPGEPVGVRYPELLDSALNRMKQSAFGEPAYPTIFSKAAALVDSLSKNHVFENANKRTALVAMLQFLSYNGLTFDMDQQQAEDFIVDIVNHKFTFHEIAQNIESHCSTK
ncbi:type II toxin-antitoxin system death-on-curing family toxin [Paenalkalicoccus suaedae]|uniref:Type II toxin-antitoxin system death-on-curing family toxin n=1 Tax=Paenalkalicoccus suaedae TaxID=2592382 RepID=A0A859FIH9_9BACI|nr:type II toxin-antitoxin system death-on-curing family toxin [Paenalkalicoccus suaedae]QKS72660.1 type II toxin-antitoxin system death-on-curing family toxin [Paenalkalicoccus suaedae]